MLPVCAVGEDGAPLFDLESGQTVPLLAYSAGAFLGRSVNQLLRQRALRSTTVYETAMADSLKTMALQGLGVAWVPRLSVTAELARGELAVCGAESWQIPLEIRLYRWVLSRKAALRLLDLVVERTARLASAAAATQSAPEPAPGSTAPSRAIGKACVTMDPA